MCKAIDDMIEDGKKEGIALTKQVFKMNSEGKILRKLLSNV